MRILMSGANGFIGPHLLHALVSAGHAVTCPVRRVIANPLDTSAARFIEADLNQPITFDEPSDAIIHCAGTAPLPGRSLPALVADNLDPTRRLIDYAERHPPKLFLFFSTMSIYGTVSAAEVNEDTPSIAPSPYGLAKLLSEELLAAASASFPAIALRLPAVLGRGAVGHWLSSVLAHARRHETITIFNPTSPFNNAVYLDDLIAFVRCLLSSTHDGFHRLTLSLDGYLEIEQVCRTLIDAAASRSQVEIRQAPHSSFTIDATRARDRFGFRSRAVGAAIHAYGRSAACSETGSGLETLASPSGVTTAADA
jgi:UDP-glucose 4-epimerase